MFNVTTFYNFKLKLLNTVALTLCLAACGFHLRGAVELSAGLSPLYLQENTAFGLGRDVEALLKSNNIDIVGQTDKANSSLILLSESKQQRVLSVDASGRAREYLLTYTANFQFKGKHIKPTNDSVSLTRTLLFDPEAVLAVTNEQATLYKDMQRDAARRILLKLQVLSASPSTKETGKAVQMKTGE